MINGKMQFPQCSVSCANRENVVFVVGFVTEFVVYLVEIICKCFGSNLCLKFKITQVRFIEFM